MYKDIISYELADNTSAEQLIEIASQIVNEWMKKMPGFIQWEIHTNSDGSYTDIVTWKSVEYAKAAEKDMCNIPNSGAWYGCYKPNSISSIKITSIATF